MEDNAKEPQLQIDLDSLVEPDPPRSEAQLWHEFLVGGYDSYVDELTFYEEVDTNALEYFCSVYGNGKESFPAFVNKYIKGIKKGRKKIHYRQKDFSKFDPDGDNNGSYRIGWFFSTNAGQNIWHMARNTLLRDKYVDFDMVNCHPTIMVQMLAHIKDQLPKWNLYLSEDGRGRQDIFDEVKTKTGLPYRYVKAVVAAIMFGCFVGIGKDKYDGEMIHVPEIREAMDKLGLFTWDQLNDKLRSIHCLQELKEEIKIAYAEFRRLYPVLYAMCKRRCESKGKTNYDGSFCHWVIAGPENCCLMAMIAEMKKRGLRMKVITKPMDEYYPDFNPDDASDDDEEEEQQPSVYPQLWEQKFDKWYVQDDLSAANFIIARLGCSPVSSIRDHWSGLH